MNRYNALLFLAATLLPYAIEASPATDFSPIAQRVAQFKAETHLPSATAVLVIKEGEILYQGYFGYADIAQQKNAAADTSFYIASATKPIFALSMLLAENNGKLSTEASLQNAFPSLAFSGLDAKAIKLKDLLTHTSGIENNALVWATAMSGVHDANSRLAMVADSHASAEAAHGTFHYTNVGYNLLSVWLEHKHNTRWQNQIQDFVLTPLGMTHSSPYMSEAQTKQWALAKPYSALNHNPTKPLYLEKVDQTMHAAGGLVATAPDLAKFLIAQMEQGKLAGKPVLPANIIAKSQQRQATTDANYMSFKRDGYAYGWYTGEYKSQPLLHHFGSFAGFHAHLSFMPEKRLGLVVLNNEDFLSSRLTDWIANAVYERLLNESFDASKEQATFDQLLNKAKGVPQLVAKEQAKIHDRKTILSLPTEHYIGRYKHAQLGEMNVTTNEKQQLIIQWGQLSATASGFDKDNIVRVEFVPNSGDLLNFEIFENKVVALKFQDLKFQRK